MTMKMNVPTICLLDLDGQLYKVNPCASYFLGRIKRLLSTVIFCPSEGKGGSAMTKGLQRKPNNIMASQKFFNNLKPTYKRDQNSHVLHSFMDYRVRIEYYKVIQKNCKGCQGAPTMVGCDLPKFLKYSLP